MKTEALLLKLAKNGGITGGLLHHLDNLNSIDQIPAKQKKLFG
jgi:hypothetical protein